MANFHMHLMGAMVAGGVCSLGTTAIFGLSALPVAGTAFVAGTMGGFLPDIDHDEGIPNKELFAFLAAILPTVLIPLLLPNAPLEWRILAYAASYVLIRFVCAPIFEKYTVHRGIIHSIPFLLLVGVMTAIALPSMETKFRLCVGASMSIGFFAHLLLDEIYAVNIVGKKLKFKKSFGTAIKFWAPSSLASISCYVALVASSVWLWRDLSA